MPQESGVEELWWGGGGSEESFFEGRRVGESWASWDGISRVFSRGVAMGFIWVILDSEKQDGLGRLGIFNGDQRVGGFVFLNFESIRA